MEQTQPAVPQPGSNAARELHANPSAGRRYKPWFLAILIAILSIAIFNGLLAWLDTGPPPPIDGLIEIGGLQNTVVDGAIAYD